MPGYDLTCSNRKPTSEDARAKPGIPGSDVSHSYTRNLISALTSVLPALLRVFCATTTCSPCSVRSIDGEVTYRHSDAHQEQRYTCSIAASSWSAKFASYGAASSVSHPRSIYVYTRSRCPILCSPFIRVIRRCHSM